MAYYSKLRPAVYHNYKNCHVGNNMVFGNLKKGRPPGAKLCKICAKLRLTGKGVPGAPVLPKVHVRAKVLAYYSKEYPEIFHVCQNCHLGQNIERAQLIKGKPKPVKGRNGKIKKPRVCKFCAKVCSAGECIPGAPIPARMGEMPPSPIAKIPKMRRMRRNSIEEGPDPIIKKRAR